MNQKLFKGIELNRGMPWKRKKGEKCKTYVRRMQTLKKLRAWRNKNNKNNYKKQVKSKKKPNQLNKTAETATAITTTAIKTTDYTDADVDCSLYWARRYDWRRQDVKFIAVFQIHTKIADGDEK